MKRHITRFFSLMLVMIMMVVSCGMAETAKIRASANIMGETIDFAASFAHDEEGCGQIVIDSDTLGLNELLLQISQTDLVAGDAESGYVQINVEELAKFLFALNYADAGIPMDKGLAIYEYINGPDFAADMQVIQETAAVEINRLAQVALNEGLIEMTEEGDITIKANIEQLLDLAGAYLKEYSKEADSIKRLCEMKIFDVIGFDLMSYYDRIPGKLVSIANEIQALSIDGVFGELYLHATTDGSMDAYVKFAMNGEEITLSAKYTSEGLNVSLVDVYNGQENLNVSLTIGNEVLLTASAGAFKAYMKLNEAGLDLTANSDNLNIVATANESGATVNAEYKLPYGNKVTFDMFLDPHKKTFDMKGSQAGPDYNITINCQYANEYLTFDYTNTVMGRTRASHRLSASASGIIYNGNFTLGSMRSVFTINANATPTSNGLRADVYATCTNPSSSFNATVIYNEDEGTLIGNGTNTTRISSEPFAFELSAQGGNVTFTSDGMTFEIYGTTAATANGIELKGGVNITDPETSDTVIPGLAFVMTIDQNFGHNLTFSYMNMNYYDEWEVVAEGKSVFNGDTWIFNANVDGETMMLTGMKTETDDKLNFAVQGMVDNQAIVGNIGIEIVEMTETALTLKPYFDMSVNGESIALELPLTITIKMDEYGYGTVALDGSLIAFQGSASQEIGSVSIAIENSAEVPAHVTGTALTAEDLMGLFQ